MMDTEEPSTAPPFEDQAPPKPSMGDEVVIDLKAMLLDRKEPPFPTSCCIYRVPHVIREESAEDYTPKVVSIGPFHHGNPRLQNLETHKQIYFKQFIDRAKSATILDELVSFVKNSEQRIRTCYSEYINLGQKELVKVILVDAIFIIELFRKCFPENLFEDDSEDDAILQNPWFMHKIEVDLLLFENQLPFFILEEFFNMSFLRRDQSLPSFLQLTFSFFEDYNTQDLEPNDLNVPIKHFTDLLRTFHLQSDIEKRGRQRLGDEKTHTLFYNASELNEAGVKLKASESKCLLNLKFSGHVLEIPPILLDGRTETLFRNIVAFEQYNYPLECYVIDYLMFLNEFIKTGKDVHALIHNDIFVNYGGDVNDVAKIFSGLSNGLLRVNIAHDYPDIIKGLNEFYVNPWNKKMSTLRSDYCRTPWQAAASTAAIVLIILTIVQTICSIIQL